MREKRRLSDVRLAHPSLSVAVLTLALLIAGGSLAPTEEAFGVTVPRLLIDGRSTGPWDPAKATVSGSITPSRGQEIFLLAEDRRTVLGKTTVPDTGNMGTFRIRIPKACFGKSSRKKFFVKSGAVRGVTASPPEGITVQVKVAKKASRKKQAIKTTKSIYTLYAYGKSARLGAKATSGGKLKITSSSASVVSVTAKGVLIPRSAGTAKVKIVQKGTDRYHRASKTVTVKVIKRKLVLPGKNRIERSLLADPSGLGIRIPSGGKVIYRSSKKDVASVDRRGRIYPKKKGKTILTVTVKETKKYRGATKTITLVIRKPTAGEGRAAAVAWAKKIAADDRFTYGGGSIAHSNGCYYCGTNGAKARRARGTRWSDGYNGKSWKRTYCCNPFIHAAYAHGAKDPAMLRSCRKKRAIDMTRSSYRSMGCFRSLGKPDFSELIPGDIFVNSYHVWMYCGGNELVEATSFGGGKKAWSRDSIRVTGGAKRWYRSCRFVMRYTGH